MTDYALLKDGAFVEVLNLDERPEDIPHKNLRWLPVEQRTGATASAVETSGKWVITTVVPAPPPRQASAGLFRQALAALGKLDAFVTALDGVPAGTRAWLEYEPVLRETDPEVIAICGEIALTVTALFDRVDALSASRGQ